MISVYKSKIYVGNQDEISKLNNDEFNVVHAAKEPFHKELVGYVGNKCPSDRYYYEDERQASLCIIDFPSSSQWDFFPEDMLRSTMDFIDRSLYEGKKVYIHCNQGKSRAPSIAFMYLVSRGLMKENTLESNLKYFIELYPLYSPANGISENIKRKYPFDYLKK